MYYILEALFLVGVGIILVAGLWLLINLLREKKRVLPPLMLGLVGAAVVLSPVMYTRFVSIVDLGERERVVDGELHLTLTGWDRDNYDFLGSKPGICVLQMANPDVTDETLALLKGQSKLKTLDLNGSQITDRGLAHLAGLQALQTLRLRGTKITDSGLNSLVESVPGIKQLDLRETAISTPWIDTWKNQQSGRRALK